MEWSESTRIVREAEVAMRVSLGGGVNMEEKVSGGLPRL